MSTIPGNIMSSLLGVVYKCIARVNNSIIKKAMNVWCFHGIALKSDNKKFIVYKLLAIETSYLATNSACFYLSRWRITVGCWDAMFDYYVTTTKTMRASGPTFPSLSILNNHHWRCMHCILDFSHDEHNWYRFRTWQTRLIWENITRVATHAFPIVCIIGQSSIYDIYTHPAYL